MSSGLDLGLDDVHVFVSGAAGGIGRELVDELLRLGCKVSCQWHRSRGTLGGLQLDGWSAERVCLVQADLTDEAQVQRAFDEAAAALGPVSVLVVNHAVFVADEAALVDMSAAQWRHTVDTNLTAAFLLVRQYLRQLRSAGLAPDDGNVGVVLISSTAALFGEAGHADYAASKAALHGLMLSAKNEIVKLHPRARVNTLAPGWVATPMARQAVERGEHFKALQTTPLRKIAAVADVTRMVAVLASGRVSGHLNGALIPLHGGMEGRVLNTIESFRAAL